MVVAAAVGSRGQPWAQHRSWAGRSLESLVQSVGVVVHTALLGTGLLVGFQAHLQALLDFLARWGAFSVGRPAVQHCGQQNHARVRLLGHFGSLHSQLFEWWEFDLLAAHFGLVGGCLEVV